MELEEVYQKRAARWTTSGANGGFPSSSSFDSKEYGDALGSESLKQHDSGKWVKM